MLFLVHLLALVKPIGWRTEQKVTYLLFEAEPEFSIANDACCVRVITYKH